MTVLVALAGLILGGLTTAAFLAGACKKATDGLGRVEQEIAWVRREVIDHRAAHEHLTALIDRRLDALEQTTAQAANEVRMASDQLMARLPAEPTEPSGS